MPMRAVVQRVLRASVSVDGSVVGTIGPGLCVFVGVGVDDGVAEASKLAEKVWHLRVFEGGEGPDGGGGGEVSVGEVSVGDVGGAVLVVSQFTLYGDTTRGRRPSWSAAASPEVAEPLVEAVVERLRALGAVVETGRFRAHMVVSLENDGPVTILLET